MRTGKMTLAIVLMLGLWIVPAGAQQTDNQPSDKKSGGALGGVLDTLGGLLNVGNRKLHGTVVVNDGNTLVLRADDRTTYRVDVASIDPAVRAKLQAGQAVTVEARGGQSDVLTATSVQPDADVKSAVTFQRVSGTVQETSKDRVTFKTSEGLVLPVDTANVHGLPYLAANQPATLYYEQGPRQEIVAVWIEPGEARQSSPSASTSSSPSTSPSASVPSAAPSASIPGAQSLHGQVQTIGVSSLTLQTADGRTVSVDTSAVDPQTVATVRPGDAVTVTGTPTADGGRFAAQSVTAAR
jgi:hypothetical protein